MQLHIKTCNNLFFQPFEASRNILYEVNIQSTWMNLQNTLCTCTSSKCGEASALIQSYLCVQANAKSVLPKMSNYPFKVLNPVKGKILKDERNLSTRLKEKRRCWRRLQLLLYDLITTDICYISILGYLTQLNQSLVITGIGDLGRVEFHTFLYWNDGQQICRQPIYQLEGRWYHLVDILTQCSLQHKSIHTNK